MAFVKAIALDRRIFSCIQKVVDGVDDPHAEAKGNQAGCCKGHLGQMTQPKSGEKGPSNYIQLEFVEKVIHECEPGHQEKGKDTER
jgi:hypothetical protein